MQAPLFETIDDATGYIMECIQRLDEGKMDKSDLSVRSKAVERVVSIYKLKLLEAGLSGRKPHHKFLNVQYADEQIENVKKIGETV